MDGRRRFLPATSLDAVKWLRSVVLDDVTNPESKRTYCRGIDRFLNWLQSQGRSTGFTKATVEAFKNHLIESRPDKSHRPDSRLSPSTVNMYLTAIRRLAAEAAESGVIAPEVASAIIGVKGLRREAVNGTRLTFLQAEEFIALPNAETLKGKRDRALLAVLIGCGLRRSEAAALTVEHLQRQEGRWVIREIVGKERKVRSVPIPWRVKAAIDDWTTAATIRTGRVFRAVNKGDRVVGHGMTAQSIFETVRKSAVQTSEFEHVVPDDLRRFYERWSRKDPSILAQIRVY